MNKYNANGDHDLVGGQVIRVPADYEVVVEDLRQDEEPNHVDSLRQLWRRRFLILIILGACMGGAIYLAMRSTPIYTASARLRLGTDTPRIQPFQETVDRSAVVPIATHINILQSRAIAARVVNTLDFVPPEPKHSTLQSKLIKPIEKMWGPDLNQNQAGLNSATVKDARMQSRVTAFLAGLKVRAVPETEIIEAEYNSPDPEFSAKALNTLCEAYIKYDFESKSGAWADAQRWLQEELGKAKGKLAQSEEALYKFAGADGREYLMLSGDAQNYYKEMEEIRLKMDGMEDKLRACKLALQKIEAGGFPDETDKGGGNLVIGQLRGQLAAAQVEYEKIKQSLGPEDPLFKAAVAARDRLAQQLSEEQKRLLNNARLDMTQAQDQLDELKKTYSGRQQHATNLQQRLSSYNVLKREVEVNQEIYDGLLRKWKEVSVGQSVQPSDVTILQRAEMPLLPGTKTRSKILLIGLLLGTGLSVGISLLLDKMHGTHNSVLRHSGNGNLENEKGAATEGVQMEIESRLDLASDTREGTARACAKSGESEVQ